MDREDVKFLLMVLAGWVLLFGGVLGLAVWLANRYPTMTDHTVRLMYPPRRRIVKKLNNWRKFRIRLKVKNVKNLKKG